MPAARPPPVAVPLPSSASAYANTTKWLTRIGLLVLCVVVLSHVRLYVRPPHSLDIIQAPLLRVTPEILAERAPVVIEDRVVDLRDVARTALAWQYAWKSPVEPCAPGTTETTTARFTLLGYMAPPGGAVTITHRDPSSGARPTRVVLEQGRAMLLPPGWSYTVEPSGTPPMMRMRLHDPVTAVMACRKKAT